MLTQESLNRFTWPIYAIGTQPLRWWFARRLRQQNRSPVTGLFLHRVADHTLNPWSISCDDFDRLLNWLTANVDLVSLDEAQRRIEHGHAGKVSVHLSFDDGYAENCLYAIPELLQRNIPFTYFVTTQNVLNGKPFPHDLKRGEPLAPNSVDEIQAMHDAGVEIGCHTRTHADLGTITRYKDIEWELRGCRDDLADWLGTIPRHFAFPYGQKRNIRPRVIQYLHDNHFASYSSALGGYNFPQSNAFHIKRFHADPLLRRVKNWLTFDPRWILATPDFEYTPFERRRPASPKAIKSRM